MVDGNHLTHRMTSQQLGVNNGIPNLNLNVNYGGHLHEADYACKYNFPTKCMNDHHHQTAVSLNLVKNETISSPFLTTSGAWGM